VRSSSRLVIVLLGGFLALVGRPADAGSVFFFSTGAPNNQMAMASRPGVGGKLEIEAADDFLTTAQTSIMSATFTGVIVPSGQAAPTIGEVDVEIYRVFPNDSNTVRTPAVPTRANSPSDVAFASKSTSDASLSFSTTTLSPSFSVLNSVLNGINKSPNQTTNGEGPVTGAEVTFNITFTAAFSLPTDHYFFIPQVQVTGGEFYWLSAERPITTGTPFSPDLQTWIRNADLDPDWLRVGTDIVGGATPPTFNGAFTLTGVVGSTPTPTLTSTPTLTPTATFTATPTVAPTATPTVTPTAGSRGSVASIPALGRPGLALLTLLLAASALALMIGRRS
jgi:hypothetical protein